MQRVRFIHTGRSMLTPGIVKAIVFVASVTSVLFMVSISQIAANMSHLGNFFEYVTYVFQAYTHTSLVVQSIVVLALAAGIWLVRDIISAWSMQRSYARS